MSITSMMRHQVSIERKANSVGADGGIIETWAVVARNIPAFVQPRPASETFDQGFDFNRTPSVIYIADVNGEPVDVCPSDRIVHEGLTYVLRGVNRFDRWEYARCDAEVLS